MVTVRVLLRAWSPAAAAGAAMAVAWVLPTSVGAATEGWARSASTSTSLPPLTPSRAGRKPGALATETDFDVVVVGAGIVGMATAREVLKRYPDLTVAVLEKERDVAPHQSSHNSGVIHAGMYYEPGSVMAATCVRGAAMMYDYCESRKLPYRRCGKMIVAANAEEHATVQELFRKGTANGVQGLTILDPAGIRAVEPSVAGYSALWSPNTGIADFGAVTRHLAKEVLATGNADIKFQFQLHHARKLTDGRVELTGVEPGQSGPAKTVRARHVITCAGFYADKVGALMGGDPKPKVVAFRGTYYQMKPQWREIVKTNVYPVPSGGGIPVGVHFTPTVDERRGHQTIVGPGACIAFSREGYRFAAVSLRDLWDYTWNGGLWRFVIHNPRLSFGELWKDVNKRAFLREAQKLIPTVTEDMVEASFAGVMAQVFNDDGKAAKDFMFERNVLGGSVLNVRNAPSPAATSSLAIAEHVVDIAEQDFGWAKAKA